ncbi:MAG: copper resistance protein B [Proteobacteria bacterium]|nr:copper resistance protein B [Pseudomonadota bacterium]
MDMPMPSAKPPAKPRPATVPKPASGKAHSVTVKPAVTAPAKATAPADHAMDAMPMDHAMGTMPAGHDMGSMPMPSAAPADHAAMEPMPMGSSAPRTPVPAPTDADRAAAFPPVAMHPMHDNDVHSFVQLDRLEGWSADPGAGVTWDGKAWFGTDLNRLWLRSEGERRDGHTQDADVEALYGRSVATWWDVVAGWRHDQGSGASQDFAAIGVMGKTPYKFDVAATAYVGQGGQTAARLDGEYELLLTNRLILQPRIELNLFGRDDPRRGIGSGLSTMETGLRLRYEITRHFAPYIGLVQERSFGRTATFHRAAGEDATDTRLVAGFHFWF